MYALKGAEYSELFRRSFSDSFMVSESSGRLPDKFSCHSSALKYRDFDILHFRGSFQDDIVVRHSGSPTHVSLHFQLNGRSDASISGFAANLPMAKGQFNLMNCVHPDSTFTFPKQQGYEYVCIGLKPTFFQTLLGTCGEGYEHLFKLSVEEKCFSLFQTNKPIGAWLKSNVNALFQAPIPQNLMSSYIQAKVTELTVLTLASGDKFTESELFSAADKDKLYAVKNHLSACFLGDLNLAGIAKQFLLNEFKLKKGFRNMFGITVFGYIFKLRMEHARYLVCHSDLSVGEVALIVGYHSDAAFIRAFKQTFGVSPGQMAKSSY